MATQNPSVSNVNQQPENMGLTIGHTITILAYVLPAFVFAGLGILLGNRYTALGFAILWTAIFFASSIRFQRKRTFLVVERFGKFWDVKFAGLRLVIPFIDNPVHRDTFLQKEVKLFEGIEIDFQGGSAPIDATGWYQIGNPADLDSGNFDAVEEQVLRYTYRVRDEDRASRVAMIYQGAFRTFLEQRDIPEAQKDMETLATKGTEAASEALAEIGVYPFPKKGIIVKDIDLPESLVKFREQETRGKADAEEAKNRARSYWEPISQMKQGLKAGGVELNDEQVVETYMQQKGLETLQKTGSNITLVSPDVKSALITIGVGKKGEA